VISGNYVHNFCDEVLIGSSFLLGGEAGLLSTLAIRLHEIPHELGVFGIMIDEGMTTKRAVKANAISAVLAIAGTAVALLLGASTSYFAIYSQPAVAGMFAYIACTDLLPSFKAARTSLRIAELSIASVASIFIILLR
jgi:zinc transporter ZupT